ncbi:hypothetical protein RHGRI_032124 [Rhododendron griersonianum]|uniref:Auxin response factor domain-containing protein n=1 Tax=Rhododendron griersonianum TaxID=479676 RepID=A0AAV6IE62_9ERIC|nr:hypothetical protein RHGRI_032124 [Rhododendron griersonianum]
MERMAGDISGGSHLTGTARDALYTELWHACAGPLVTLPREGERAYYFPEGHMEQLKASTHQGLDQQLPSFNLPAKILCKVMYVQLRADPETDEVYAQITLLPEADTCNILLFLFYRFDSYYFLVWISKPRSPAQIHLFRNLKVAMSIHFARHLLRLTQAHMVDFLFFGGMRMIACLHWICPSSHPGRNWLQLIFVAMNGTFVTYFVVSILLLTASWCEGENGELRVGVRKLMRQPNNMPSSVISTHSMHIGLLATASHAISTGTLFSVFYWPRTSRSEFVVSVNRYLEARSHKLSVGMRFKMRFEGEEVPERRYYA